MKCSLDDEVAKDAEAIVENLGDRIAAVTAVYVLMLQPALSALELIGRPRGERWDFWEIYSGCGNFTAAVAAVGLIVGPPADLLPKEGGLMLDFLSQKSQALLQALLEEARPRWLHVAPPCTFWCAIGRWTACKTPERWEALRQRARELWCFALQMLVLQARHEARGSLEQPPRCASWRLKVTQSFYAEQPDWDHYHWPSCVFGMKDPESGLPWQKMQGFLSNADLGPMAVKGCTCTTHGHVQGTIKSGPRRGQRRTTIAGEYPTQMCQALAMIVKGEVSVVP